jgi:glycosyltransferase involved in cell wall biosynthesis
MIVKNEEKYLAGCLESVKGIAGEIIIADTGSTDNTISIAERYNARVLHFPWIGDFAAARNFSLQHASGDWILYLDADERLNASSAPELKSITSGKPSFAYKCKVISIDNNSNHHSVMSYSRLFPNLPGVKFNGKVHEQIEDSLKENNIPVLNSSVEIIHLGYNAGQDVLKSKAERNLSILLDEYKKYGSSYYAFQLGQTLGILNREQDAESYFSEALKDNRLQKEYSAVACRYIAINNAERKDYNKALEYIERSIAEDGKQPLSLMAAAKIYLRFKMNAEAADAAVKAYNANVMFFSKDSASAQNIMMDEKELCVHGLEVAIKIADRDLFNFFYRKISDNGNSEFDIFNLVYNNEPVSLLKLNSYIAGLKIQYLEPLLTLLENYTHPEAKETILRQLSIQFTNNAAIHLQLGRLHLSNGKYEEAEKEIEKTVDINPGEPSFYFYLVSVYMQNSRFEKLPGVLEKLEQRFGSSPEIRPKIEILKQKLLSFLQH